MMERFDEYDEQAQQHWQARVARQRLDLSVSVEETMLDTSLQEDQEGDEVDQSGLPSQGSSLIPPRLSLQSKPLPVVHPDASSELLTSSTSGSTALSPAPQATAGKAQSYPKIEGVSPASPAAYTLAPIDAASSQVRAAQPALSKVDEAAPALPRISSRRTTKVRLQVVPRPEETQSNAGIEVCLPAAATNLEAPCAQEQVGQPAPPLIETRGDIKGSGVFERGQCDLAIANEHITASSVVVVVLTGDPGPVVVQYISLQPQAGFTIHLSAAAKNATSFNYAIL